MLCHATPYHCICVSREIEGWPMWVDTVATSPPIPRVAGVILGRSHTNHLC